MKRYLFIIFLLFGISSANAQLLEQFEEFSKRSQKEFENFKENRQAEFADFLKEKWSNFDLQVGVKETEPIPPPIPNLKAPSIVDKPKELEVMDSKPEPIEVVKLPEVPQPEPILENKESKVKISFFGEVLNITFDQGIKVKLKSTTEASVSDFWKEISKANNGSLLYTCQLIQETYKLNDWGYYLLVKDIAEAIYANQSDEQAVFSCFLLDKAGYDVRLCLVNKSKLKLMLHAQQMIYSTSFYTVSGKKYFIIGDKNSKSCRSYSGEYDKGNKKPFDLTAWESIRLKNETAVYTIASSVLGETMEVRYNKNLIDFYKTYPMTDFEVYFNSRPSTLLENSLYKQLQKYIEGKNEYEAVNLLLHFAQFGFKYATDLKQFGYERYFFCEELFAYPYSDCEDRSVLFARLVRDLLDLSVIGLSYPGHMATAVCFSERINGDYVVYNNQKYYVCDPTYYGAKAGQSMQEFKNRKATPIRVN